MIRSITIKAIIVFYLSLVCLLLPITTFAEWTAVEDSNIYSINIDKKKLEVAFVYENGRHINELTVPNELIQMPNGCLFAKGLISPYFHEMFDAILCYDGDSLIWAKLTSKDVFLVPNWLSLKKDRE